jgi:hypothetical protein
MRSEIRLAFDIPFGGKIPEGPYPRDDALSIRNLGGYTILATTWS